MFISLNISNIHFTLCVCQCLTHVFRGLYRYFQYPTWGCRKTYLQIFLFFSFIFIFWLCDNPLAYSFKQIFNQTHKLSVHQYSYLQYRTTSVNITQHNSVLKRNSKPKQTFYFHFHSCHMGNVYALCLCLYIYV